MRLSYIAVSALFLTGSVWAADAPAAAPPAFTMVRGTISAVDGMTVTVKKDDGTTVTAPLTPKSPVSAVEKRTFDQIKPTDFVGITSVPGQNGHLQAEEIHIIPIHVGEGSYPWDHHPGGQGAKRAGSMTNGTVAPATKRAGSMTNGTVAAGDAPMQLKVSYRGSEMVDGKCVGHAPMTPDGGCTGSSIVDVTPSTAIAAIVPSKATELKPGLQIVGSTVTTADGKTVWGNITAEKNGVKPEF
ncbi:MAG TPA: hypothetical protein VGG10_06210 [Rhizomicrobium sp.]|jgi:hypothetical protein